ncbi:hypothetical protein BJ742DRAFT_735974 [Cladochytrium replicatum]|nr:hypothetical protein BJ742DRAFT_735974 [Cladochytrium replicatum]
MHTFPCCSASVVSGLHSIFRPTTSRGADAKVTVELIFCMADASAGAVGDPSPPDHAEKQRTKGESRTPARPAPSRRELDWNPQGIHGLSDDFEETVRDFIAAYTEEELSSFPMIILYIVEMLRTYAFYALQDRFSTGDCFRAATSAGWKVLKDAGVADSPSHADLVARADFDLANSLSHIAVNSIEPNAPARVKEKAARLLVDDFLALTRNPNVGRAAKRRAKLRRSRWGNGEKQSNGYGANQNPRSGSSKRREEGDRERSKATSRKQSKNDRERDRDRRDRHRIPDGADKERHREYREKDPERQDRERERERIRDVERDRERLRERDRDGYRERPRGSDRSVHSPRPSEAISPPAPSASPVLGHEFIPTPRSDSKGRGFRVIRPSGGQAQSNPVSRGERSDREYRSRGWDSAQESQPSREFTRVREISARSPQMEPASLDGRRGVHEFSGNRSPPLTHAMMPPTYPSAAGSPLLQYSFARRGSEASVSHQNQESPPRGSNSPSMPENSPRPRTRRSGSVPTVEFHHHEPPALERRPTEPYVNPSDLPHRFPSNPASPQVYVPALSPKFEVRRRPSAVSTLSDGGGGTNSRSSSPINMRRRPSRLHNDSESEYDSDHHPASRLPAWSEAGHPGMRDTYDGESAQEVDRHVSVASSRGKTTAQLSDMLQSVLDECENLIGTLEEAPTLPRRTTGSGTQNDESGIGLGIARARVIERRPR